MAARRGRPPAAAPPPASPSFSRPPPPTPSAPGPLPVFIPLPQTTIGPGGGGRRLRPPRPPACHRLVARMTRATDRPFPGANFVHHLGQVVGRRRLHWWIGLERLQVA